MSNPSTTFQVPNPQQWIITHVSDDLYEITGLTGFPKLEYIRDERPSTSRTTEAGDHYLRSQRGRGVDLSADPVSGDQNLVLSQDNIPESSGDISTSITQRMNGSQLQPGTYIIRNRETLSQLLVWENSLAPVARLQTWGIVSSASHYKFDVSEEKNGTVAITSTYNLSCPRYLIDGGGPMMDTTKANRVKLIPAGNNFFYIVVNLQENMALKDGNPRWMPDRFASLEELELGNRRQMWDFCTPD